MDDQAEVGVVVVIAVIVLVVALAGGTSKHSPRNQSTSRDTPSERASQICADRSVESRGPAASAHEDQVEPEPIVLSANIQEAAKVAEERAANLGEVVSYLDSISRKAAETQEHLLEVEFRPGPETEHGTTEEAKNASQ